MGHDRHDSKDLGEVEQEVEHDSHVEFFGLSVLDGPLSKRLVSTGHHLLLCNSKLAPLAVKNPRREKKNDVI